MNMVAMQLRMTAGSIGSIARRDFIDGLFYVIAIRLGKAQAYRIPVHGWRKPDINLLIFFFILHDLA
jgi:hypothetical protein